MWRWWIRQRSRIWSLQLRKKWSKWSNRRWVIVIFHGKVTVLQKLVRLIKPQFLCSLVIIEGSFEIYDWLHFGLFSKYIIILLINQVHHVWFFWASYVALASFWVCRKQVWAKFSLSFHNQKLLDDNSVLQDFGIFNNSKVIALFLVSIKWNFLCGMCLWFVDLPMMFLVSKALLCYMVELAPLQASTWITMSSIQIVIWNSWPSITWKSHFRSCQSARIISLGFLLWLPLSLASVSTYILVWAIQIMYLHLIIKSYIILETSSEIQHWVIIYIFVVPMQVHFVSYVMSKGSQRHSRRRKHRFFHGLNKRA